VQVYIELRRPSDGATSDPLPFQMLPLFAGKSKFYPDFYEKIISLGKK